MSFDLTQLSSNPFLAGVLSGVVDIPAYLIFPLLNSIGRRRSMGLFLIIAAVAMFLSLIGEQPALRLTLSLIGKLGASSAFTMAGFYFGEVVPTQVRALATTLVMVATSVGGAVAPFVVTLVTQLHGAAPSVVFGVAALLASAVTLLLPETLGKRMPETPADVEAVAQASVSSAPPEPPQAKGSGGRNVSGPGVSAQCHSNASFEKEEGSVEMFPE